MPESILRVSGGLQRDLAVSGRRLAGQPARELGDDVDA